MLTQILEPQVCGRIFASDSNPEGHGRATVYDGFQIGMKYSMDNSPRWMGNDWLSRIHVNKGNRLI